MPEHKEYGLIGYPLEHSFSPAYFREKFERERTHASYEAYPLEHINGLNRLLASHPQLRGFNVTTPYKQDVMALLDEVAEDALHIGAVNCVAIREGKLIGYNTDWIGFRDSLIPLLKPELWPALILGNGGASKAVQHALEQLGIAYSIVSRTAGEGILSYAEAGTQAVETHPLIINTTTLGTLGEGLPSLPYDALTKEHLLYDLVYNPALTPFLEEGAMRGCVVKNGLQMLQLQAEASWQIWQGSNLSD